MERHSGIALLLAALLLATAADAGTWRRLPNSVYGERYDDLHFVTPEIGWAVNGFGEIWHTTDGGETWQLQYDNGYIYFRSIEFANERVGWAGTVTSDTPLFATTDGGETWAPVTNLPTPPPVAICGIDVVNENVMYAVGVWSGPAYILKTTDGGTTWSGIRLPSASAVGLVDVHFKSETEGFVVGGVGNDLFSGRTVIIRTDDGHQWYQHFVGSIIESWAWKISFPTEEVGYVSVERLSGSHHFLKTTDGGDTWAQMLFEGGARSQGIGFVTEKIGWIGGPAAENPTYITTDGGATWTIDGFGSELNCFQFFGTAIGYGAGDYIYKYARDAVDVADTQPVLDRRPRSHPNPFRPMTTIGYSLPRASEVRVFVSDPGGRLVRTLTETHMPAGEHEITWDGRNDEGEEVASGLYLYVIRSDALDAIGKLVKVD